MIRNSAIVTFVTLMSLGCTPAPMVEEDALPFAEASATATPDPAAFGPYPVGVRTVTYEDGARRKPDGSPRLLKTEIWYPAVQSARGQPGVDYQVLEYFTPEQQAAIGADTIPILHTPAVRDAAPTRAHGKFPFIVFSHGQAAMRYQSTYYTVLLASHGYVVISTDHEGGTLADVARGELQNVAVGVETRPIDVKVLINRYERLKEDDPLYGLVDMDKVGVTGHSFGALTSLRIAAMDSRVKAIVPQAPTDVGTAWFGFAMPVHLGIPVHIQAAHEDKTLPWDENIAPSIPLMDSPFWLLDIVKGGHFTFSDICAFDLAAIADRIQLDIPGANVRNILSDGCGPTAPAASVAQPLIDHFAVAFFNAHLKGSTGSLELMSQAKADSIGGTGTAVLTTK